MCYIKIDKLSFYNMFIPKIIILNSILLQHVYLESIIINDGVVTCFWHDFIIHMAGGWKVYSTLQ